MNLYNYDKNTKEYLSTTLASADPMETKIRGEFVPLVPANATLIEPPTVEANQVAVFENNKWVIKADYRKDYKKVTDEFITEYIKDIGEIADGCVVTKELADEIDKNPDRFKIDSFFRRHKSD